MDDEMDVEVKELQKEMDDLLKEWKSIIDFAEYSLYNYSEKKTKKNIENMEHALTWFLDHLDRVDDCGAKVDMIHNREGIVWN